MPTPQRVLKEITEMSVASAIATALDALLFLVLEQSFGQWWTFATAVHAGAGAVFGGWIHYTLCSRWVFGAQSTDWRTASPKYIAMSAGAALLHSIATQYASAYTLSQIGWGVSKVVVYVLWTYPVSRYWVFSNTSQEDSS